MIPVMKINCFANYIRIGTTNIDLPLTVTIIVTKLTLTKFRVVLVEINNNALG